MKNKNLIYIIILGLVGAAVVIFLATKTAEPQKVYRQITDLPLKLEKINEAPVITTTVVLQTNKGDIKIGLFDEHRPITVGNFISLIKKDFYDGLIFHRVIDDFMIQGGCPYGTGFGNPGYTIKCELEAYNKNVRGTISMANAGRDTGGSQFFINLIDNNFLDDRHSVFGKVLEGMDVVDAIGRTETGLADRPTEDIVIKNIEIVKK
jgi:peptidylprolyl isomerase